MNTKFKKKTAHGVISPLSQVADNANMQYQKHCVLNAIQSLLKVLKP